MSVRRMNKGSTTVSTLSQVLASGPHLPPELFHGLINVPAILLILLLTQKGKDLLWKSKKVKWESKLNQYFTHSATNESQLWNTELLKQHLIALH